MNYLTPLVVAQGSEPNWLLQKKSYYLKINNFNRVLKNVFEAASARRKLSKERSLHPVNEHFETIFNAAIATQIVFQQPVNNYR